MRQNLSFLGTMAVLAFISLLISVPVWGQRPIIVGDTMICPEAVGRLEIPAVYDSYQWYRRYFGSTQEEKLDGATTHQLDMPYFEFAATYIRVEVEVGGERLASDTVFVDGWVFVPATVASVGNYTVNFDGEFVLCEGDSIQFSLSSTYSENITWYKDGLPIEGETSSVLVVKTPGVYYVEGAPELCPDFLQGPGLPLVVVFCSSTSISDKENNRKLLVYPNPVRTEVFVDLSGYTQPQSYILTDFLGRHRLFGQLDPSQNKINLNGQIAPGIYLLSFPEISLSTKLVIE